MPVRDTVSGAPGTFAEICRLAVRELIACGVKVTLIVQLLFGLMLAPQLPDWPKSPGSAPVKPIEVSGIAFDDVLLSVTACGALVLPSAVEEKVKLAGELNNGSFRNTVTM